MEYLCLITSTIEIMYRILIFFCLLFCWDQARAGELSDSTLHEKFIFNLLTEFKEEGRWLLVAMEQPDSIAGHWAEIIHPMTIYNFYSSGFTDWNEKRFLYDAFSTLSQREYFSRTRKDSSPIRGIKVDSKKFYFLRKISIKKILTEYFDSRHQLKVIGKKYLTELIAICYLNNIKVITPKECKPYYFIFR